MIKSIFNLKDRKEDLSSANQGMADLYYDQVLPLRSVVDTSTVARFGNGIITFRFQPPVGYWWIPNKSYFKIVYELTDVNDEPLAGTDGVAPTMGMASNLFSKMKFKINDKDITEISEHVPEIDALKTRLTRSGHWMTTTGQALNFWDSRYEARLEETVKPGTAVDDRIMVDLLQPPTNHAGTELPFLDYDGPNSVTFFITNKIGIFAGAGEPIPDLSQYIEVGSIIYLFDTEHLRARVIGFETDVSTNDTILVDNILDETLASKANLDAAGVTALFRQVTIPFKVVDPDENRTSQASTRELIYCPPLAIFDVEHALPGGSKFEFDFTPFPNNVYQKNVVESLDVDKVPGVDYNFRVTAFEMYVARCQGPILENKEFFIDLEEIRCQVSQIETTSRTQTALDVIPSTTALTVAFQDSSAGNSTLQPLSKFKIADNAELGLTDFYIRYAGKQKPQPDFMPHYSLGDDRMVEVYARSLIYSNGINLSTAETLAEWRSRGLYLYWPWPKTGYGRETRCYVQTQFDSSLDFSTSPRLLLFNHYKKVCVVSIKDGTVVEVLSSNA